MANKKNPDKPSFADFFNELVAAKAAQPIVDAREERKYFLIVSEGVRTEPIYFDSYYGTFYIFNFFKVRFIEPATLQHCQRYWVLNTKRTALLWQAAFTKKVTWPKL